MTVTYSGFPLFNVGYSNSGTAEVNFDLGLNLLPMVGSVAVLYVAVGSGSGTISSLGGGGVSSWKKLVQSGSPSVADNEIWWGPISGSGHTSITGTLSTSSFLSLSMYQFTTTGQPYWFADPVTSLSGSITLVSGTYMGFSATPSITISELLVAQILVSGTTTVSGSPFPQFDEFTGDPPGDYLVCIYNSTVSSVVSGYQWSTAAQAAAYGNSVAGFLYTYDYPLSSDEPISHTQITQPYYNGTASYYYVKQPHITRNYTKTATVNQVQDTIRRKFISKLNSVTKVLTTIAHRAAFNYTKFISTVQVSYPFQVVHRLALKTKHISQNLYGGEQLYTFITHQVQHLTRAVSTTLINSNKEQKQIIKSIKTVKIQSIKLSKFKLSILKTVNISTSSLQKTINKPYIIATKINSSRINKLFTTSTKVVLIDSIKMTKKKLSILRAILIRSIKQGKLKTATLRTVEVNTTRLNKKKTTNITSTRVQTSRINKIKTIAIKVNQIKSSFFRAIVGKRFNVVSVNSIKQLKLINKLFKVVEVFTIRNSKKKTTTVNVTKTNTSRVNKLKSTILKFVQVNTEFIHQSNQVFHKLISIVQINITNLIKQKAVTLRTTEVNSVRTNKQKQSILRVVKVQTIRLSKFKTTIIRTVKISPTFVKKLVSKSSRTTYIQKAGNLEKTIHQIVAAVGIWTAITSKSVRKKLTANSIKSIRQNKLKSTTVKINKIQSARINKQKQAKIKPTQILNTTVTRRVNRGRGITALITYTIANSKHQTLSRKIYATMVSVFNINKKIDKNTIVSNVSSSLTGKTKLHSFLIQFVTKILSLNRQTIQKPNYGRPDPDFWDPNMIDPSTPSVDGLVYGNPDDDR